MWERKYLDKNRGLQHDSFVDALQKIRANHDTEELGEGGVRRNPGTDIADPYGVSIKPKGVPVWDHAPVSPEEEAIYYGVHIHSESNPLGLHTHIIGGKLTGAHSHSPQNRFGAHHHRSEEVIYGINVDGAHVHDGENAPCGHHNHDPKNFG